MKFIVGFSKAKSPWKFGSKIIQLVENRPFSHCYIRYDSPATGINLVSQASHGYVNLVNSCVFFKENDQIEEYEIDCTDEQFKDIQIFTHKNLGVKYSQTELILIGIKKLFNIKLNIRDYDESFICSEWAARICQIDGIDLIDIIDQDYLTPSDFNEIIKNLNISKGLL